MMADMPAVTSPAVPRISDPSTVPVREVDSHLPAVAPGLLVAEAIRARFPVPAGWQPEVHGDGRFGSDRLPAAAAVLVPLVSREDGLHVLLTQRTAHLKHHPGQVCFPGGKVEPGDADLETTALREAQEEIGLEPRHVELVGRLPVYTTVTRFVITPVVALVHPPFDLRPDTDEVAEVFEVPLVFLMDPAHHRRHLYSHEGGSRQFLSMPWRPAAGPAAGREFFIWGATASMLRNLYRLLADASAVGALPGSAQGSSRGLVLEQGQGRGVL
jgi:8-oxo-dGTP pyrophosphatase MutT (NUDIX family)